MTQRLRYEILKRDGYRCQYCGASAEETELRVDHVVPRALNGTDSPDNLVAACVECNTGKSSTHPDAETVARVSAKQFAWRAAIDDALQAFMDEKAETDAAADDFADAWNGWTYPDGRRCPIPDDWRTSFERWLRLGFTAEHLISLLPVSMKKTQVQGSGKWPYFCGVVWRVWDEIKEKVDP